MSGVEEKYMCGIVLKWCLLDKKNNGFMYRKQYVDFLFCKMKKKQNLKQFKSLLLFKINSFQLMF